jgi:cytochrome c oxidase cbb3-type subunit I/II
MAMLGVPYGDAVLHAEAQARAQAHAVGEEIAKQGGPQGLERKKIVALIAYLQRLGTDIKKLPPAPDGAGPLRARNEDAKTPPTSVLAQVTTLGKSQ